MSKFKNVVVWLAGFGFVTALGALSAGSLAAQSPSAVPAAPHQHQTTPPAPASTTLLLSPWPPPPRRPGPCAAPCSAVPQVDGFSVEAGRFVGVSWRVGASWAARPIIRPSRIPEDYQIDMTDMPPIRTRAEA